ncbi:MAG: hypothetical protein ACHP79_14235 [Terriglobales bacterium]
MERIEYDPEGGNYLPGTQRETGFALIISGGLLLVGGLGWALFLGAEMRVGSMLMRAILSTDVTIALLLIAAGFYKKRRRKK